MHGRQNIKKMLMLSVYCCFYKYMVIVCEEGLLNRLMENDKN